MRCLSGGKHINKVELSACKAGDPQIEYMRITLEEVLLTGLTCNGTSASEWVNMTYNFQAARVRQQYWEQTEKGGRGAETAAGWNIIDNREL